MSLKEDLTPATRSLQEAEIDLDEYVDIVISIISNHLPEKKELFIGTCPLKGSCDGPRCKYEHEEGYEYYNLAIDEVNKLLTTQEGSGDASD